MNVYSTVLPKYQKYVLGKYLVVVVVAVVTVAVAKSVIRSKIHIAVTIVTMWM